MIHINRYRVGNIMSYLYKRVKFGTYKIYKRIGDRLIEIEEFNGSANKLLEHIQKLQIKEKGDRKKQ